MASFYSSFFNSGLLAAHPDDNAPTDSSRNTTPVPDPSTPRALPKSLDGQTTPTAHDLALPLPASASSNNVIPALAAAPSSSPERPRLRRRRSSIGLAASPVASIKGTRATNLQRQSLVSMSMSVSQGRARSGSVTDNALASRVAAMSVAANPSANANVNKDAPKAGGPGIVGRLRSGSVGAALRPRRTRRHLGVPAPAPPPPTAPLPALPALPALSIRPPNRRAQTQPADSLPPTPTATAKRISMSAAPLVSGAARALSLDVHSLKFDAFLRGKNEREQGYEYDYPSPLDTPASVREEYFGSDVVMAL